MQQVETQTSGMIVSICYTPESTNNPRPQDHYARTPIDSVELIAGRGIDVDRLKPGDRVKLGETAILEVDKARTGCDRFEHIQGQPKSRVAGRLGQMTRVLVSGAIRVGDAAKKE